MEHLPRQRVRWWLVLLAGVAATVAAGQVDGDLSVALHLTGAVALGAFAVANLHLVGMVVLLLGLSLNVLVVGVNGGMPVRPAALVDAGIVEPGELSVVELAGPRHLAERDDRLTAVGDAVPVAPLGQVLSIGDLVVLAGLGNVAFRLSHRRGRHGASDPSRFWDGTTHRRARSGIAGARPRR